MICSLCDCIQSCQTVVADGKHSPLNAITSYVNESKFNCMGQLNRKKEDLTVELALAKNVIDRLLKEAKSAGKRTLLIHFFKLTGGKLAGISSKNSILGSNREKDYIGCALNDVTISETTTDIFGRKILTGFKRSETKPYYRIGVDLLSVPTISQCSEKSCVFVGEYCDVATQKALKGELGWGLSEYEIASGVDPVRQAVVWEKQLRLQSQISVAEVEATCKIGLGESIAFLAWNYLSAGFSVEVRCRVSFLSTVAGCVSGHESLSLPRSFDLTVRIFMYRFATILSFLNSGL